MNQEEHRILEALDLAVRAEGVSHRIKELVSRAEQKLLERSGEVLAWEPIPVELYKYPLPAEIRSSWVFVLRANSITGAERHPNSHQRMLSYRGHGNFQTRAGSEWQSHVLRSDPTLPIEDRWISIPAMVWHQALVPDEDWVVVSFHTAEEQELIEERPVSGAEEILQQKKYAEDRWSSQHGDTDVYHLHESGRTCPSRRLQGTRCTGLGLQVTRTLS